MKKKSTSLLLALTLCISCLPACGGASNEPAHVPWHPPAASVAAAAAPGDETASEKDSGPAAADAPEADEPEADEPPAEPDPASIHGVARLGDLVGNYNAGPLKAFENEIFVDTEDDHNPYDLTWRYGPDSKRLKDFESPEWDALYNSYVAACDWSLVFNAEYYKKAFPMLAMLYHENDELLLEHFQTQGVHEGRQASENFNVSAYMTNCDNNITSAFGENYERYYFYYMLNQDTQKSVSTANTGGEYPRWRTLELSAQQSNEYNGVNWYREEVKQDPLTIDPEIIALANYRAWTDAEYNLYAHDWIDDTNNLDEIYDMIWKLGYDRIGENTVKWYSKGCKDGMQGSAGYYRNSKEHYEAMISEEYHYFGCSNPYWSDNPDNPFTEDGNTGYLCQFDMFTTKQPSIPYELD